jgi:hypothetical protein
LCLSAFREEAIVVLIKIFADQILVAAYQPIQNPRSHMLRLYRLPTISATIRSYKSQLSLLARFFELITGLPLAFPKRQIQLRRLVYFQVLIISTPNLI